MGIIAIQTVPFHATLRKFGALGTVVRVQVMPLVEVSTLPPGPTARKRLLA